MQNDPDYQMALLLQQQFNVEFSTENPSQSLTYNKKKTEPVNNKKCLTDPSWELVDPTPNIFLLFVQFNERFFWEKLGSVAVSWSKRMTSCAGICSYQGRGGLCHITLSEPLLKLRPRKDLVETLLHEMIHAFLFVTHNNRDRDGHGPEFHKHMYRINGEAGTNITVYHDFHDEVRLYKQHWWRCDGPCQKNPPYFGMVRRAMNRAPGPYDRWFADHQQKCGGKFIKVKEPEKNDKIQEKNKKIASPANLPDIRNYLPVKNNIHTINTVGPKSGLGTKNKNGTVVLNPKNSTKTNEVSVSSIIPSSSNIVGFSKDGSKILDKNNIEVFSGSGKKLSNSSSSNNNPDYNTIRNHWANKFPINKRKSLDSEPEIVKKPKTETPIKKSCPNCDKLFPETELNAHLNNCLSADDSIKSEFSNDSLILVECPVCKVIIEEDDMNSHLDDCLVNNDPEKSKNKPENDKTKCDICNIGFPPEEYTLHIQDCLNKFYDKVEENLDIKTTTSGTVLCLVCNKSIIKDLLNDHLEECMGTVFDKDNFEDTEEAPLNKTIYNCPICMEVIEETDMNRHIDECLNKDVIKNEFS